MLLMSLMEISKDRLQCLNRPSRDFAFPKIRHIVPDFPGARMWSDSDNSSWSKALAGEAKEKEIFRSRYRGFLAEPNGVAEAKRARSNTERLTGRSGDGGCFFFFEEDVSTIQFNLLVAPIRIMVGELVSTTKLADLIAPE